MQRNKQTTKRKIIQTKPKHPKKLNVINKTNTQNQSILKSKAKHTKQKNTNKLQQQSKAERNN